jgi:hypothetical protein
MKPTLGLELPAVRGTRDRIASPEEAAALLAALPADRAIWATAMYAGLAPDSGAADRVLHRGGGPSTGSARVRVG